MAAPSAREGTLRVPRWRSACPTLSQGGPQSVSPHASSDPMMISPSVGRLLCHSDPFYVKLIPPLPLRSIFCLCASLAPLPSPCALFRQRHPSPVIVNPLLSLCPPPLPTPALPAGCFPLLPLTPCSPSPAQTLFSVLSRPASAPSGPHILSDWALPPTLTPTVLSFCTFLLSTWYVLDPLHGPGDARGSHSELLVLENLHLGAGVGFRRTGFGCV